MNIPFIREITIDHDKIDPSSYLKNIDAINRLDFHKNINDSIDAAIPKIPENSAHLSPSPGIDTTLKKGILFILIQKHSAACMYHCLSGLTRFLPAPAFSPAPGFCFPYYRRMPSLPPGQTLA